MDMIKSIGFSILLPLVVLIIIILNKNIKGHGDRKNKKSEDYMVEGIAIGLAFGPVISNVLAPENLGLGMGLGLLLGLAIGTGIKKKSLQ